MHLGRLAAYLRMLGFDTRYDNQAGDAELADIASAEQRILLTRDRGLLMRSAVTRGYWLRHTGGRRQTAEIVGRFDLARSFRPFTRCMACNAVLQAVAKQDAERLVPARAAVSHTEFQCCPNCGRVYWKGSHYRRMQNWIEELTRLPDRG